MGRLEDTSVFLYSDWLHFVWRSKEKTIVKKTKLHYGCLLEILHEMPLEKIDHIFACLDPVDNGTVSFRSEGYRNLMYLQLQCKKNV